jgi:hypothetical protein
MIGIEKKVSAKMPIIDSFGMETTYRTSFTATQLMTSTQGTSTSNTESDSANSVISVDLPPHTEVLIEQSRSANSMEIVYDYPVYITYKVAVGAMWGRWDDNVPDEAKRTMHHLATFGRADVGHTNAVDNLYRRWGEDMNIESNFGDGIPWAGAAGKFPSSWMPIDLFYYYLADYTNNFSEDQNGGLSGAQTHYVLNRFRPMSVTGGLLTRTYEGFSSRVYGIAPMYPLDKVRLTDAGAYAMSPGDRLYVNSLDVDGLNPSGVPFYGFDAAFGKWVLLDENGVEAATPEYDARGNTVYQNDVAALVTDRVSGATYLQAKNASGDAYLKYMINENAYTYSGGSVYATNASLSETAVAMIGVEATATPFDGKVELRGELTGYVNDPPINLDTYPGLDARVIDAADVEIRRPVVWEAREDSSRGIDISGNMLSFTRTGVFNIRARTEDVWSEWLQVEALGERALNVIYVDDITDPLTLSADVTAGDATVDLSLLAVSTADQYGAPWANLSGLTWVCEPLEGVPAAGPLPADAVVNGDVLTVSEDGVYEVYAIIGGVESNRLKLIAHDDASEDDDGSGGSGGSGSGSGGGGNSGSGNRGGGGGTGSAPVSPATPTPAPKPSSTPSRSPARSASPAPASSQTAGGQASVGAASDGSTSGDSSRTGRLGDQDVPLGAADSAPGTELPFTDVGADDWFYDDVKYVWQNGLFTGVAGNAFAPEQPITRAMLVTVLYRFTGGPDGANGAARTGAATDNAFTDVPEGEWYTEAVNWAARNGLVLGYGDGNFGPDDLITRQDMAVIFKRYADFAAINPAPVRDAPAFADAANIADYANEAVAWAYEIGIVNGKPDNRFDPAGNTTRAETAAILHRLAISVGDA